MIIFSIYTKLLKIAKKNNITFGLIIFEILSVGLFFILPGYLFFFYGEIGVIVGTILGMYFAFHYRKETQRILKIDLIFLFIGNLIISISLSLIEWIYNIPVFGLNPIVFLSFFISNLIMVFFYELFIGVFMAYFYRNKEPYQEERILN